MAARSKLKSLVLIQIGDIHFPDALGFAQDVKDHGFPGNLATVCSPQPLAGAIRALTALCERGVDGILVCGDLTSNGDFGGYGECIDYLGRAGLLKGSIAVTIEGLHVVPGNHDVDRALCDPAAKDLFRKFEPLEKAWAERGLPVLSASAIRATDIKSKDGVRGRALSLNSCVGCGETRYLPSSVATELKGAFDKHAAELGKQDGLEPHGETLDTPAVAEEHINEICKEIDGLGTACIAIVVAHHNVLPQATPRIALYAELVNAGLVRSRLLACNKPVIYCHGHIHDDPLEMVRQPGGDALICVSAPPLVKGFNLMTVEYGRRGQPIGCEITPYRTRRAGSVGPREPLRVPLCSPRTAATVRDERTTELLRYVPRMFARFPDVFRKIRRYGKRPRPNQQTLAATLAEAEWLGFAEILDRDQSVEHWQVRRLPA